jgi:hypothetical protein
MYFREHNIRFAVATITDSLINRARNSMTAKFMGQEQLTHLMCIDADIAWEPEDVIKMLWHDKEIMTGAYPIKSINWESVERNVKAGVPTDELLGNSLRFVVNAVKDKESQALNVSNGAVEIFDAGTGFMLIKRDVIEKMQNAYPETMYYSDKDFSLDLAERKRFALFDTMIDQDGRYLSEDYTFCRRWQGLAGKIYVDIRAVLNHTGTHTFAGAPLVTKLPS